MRDYLTVPAEPTDSMMWAFQSRRLFSNAYADMMAKRPALDPDMVLALDTARRSLEAQANGTLTLTMDASMIYRALLRSHGEDA